MANIRYFRLVLVNMLVLWEKLRAMETVRRPGVGYSFYNCRTTNHRNISLLYTGTVPKEFSLNIPLIQFVG
jgi:hypothetical protein